MSAAIYILGAVILALLARNAFIRLQLLRAKHPTLAGHPRLGKWVARQIPFYEFSDERFFSVDQAPAQIAARRRDGFMRLAKLYTERYPQSAKLTEDVHDNISDLQFINRYRVPFPFGSMVRRHLRGGVFLQASGGVMVTDLDGNQYYDLTGSYGVNVFGYDFYKGCIERAVERVRGLGPVLGAYHPVVAYNAKRLCAISRLDEVSFHMSGTEAVMQAVRLARYHTGRSHLVRFCGAYHGWWGDVQPGVGNPQAARNTYTLKEMHEDSLHVLRTRRDIACVVVNPLQALHPNRGAPGDSSLVDSSRRAGFDRTAYARWLQELRAVCTERGIVLILDDVFLGFRLAVGGAQEYFDVRADMVTFGKTLGGGLPIGALCGRGDLMRRYRNDRPGDVCFARGTFNSHPYVMGAMYEFLRALDTPGIQETYRNLAIWDRRAEMLNARLREAGLPMQVRNLSSVWTLDYTQPSRCNWMLQFYLRAHGLALSWVGTGRFILSLNFTDHDFAEVMGRVVAAGVEMQQDAWWWRDGQFTDVAIRRQILREMVSARFNAATGRRSG